MADFGRGTRAALRKIRQECPQRQERCSRLYADFLCVEAIGISQVAAFYQGRIEQLK